MLGCRTVIGRMSAPAPHREGETMARIFGVDDDVLTHAIAAYPVRVCTLASTQASTSERLYRTVFGVGL